MDGTMKFHNGFSNVEHLTAFIDIGALLLAAYLFYSHDNSEKRRVPISPSTSTDAIQMGLRFSTCGVK
jgi:hypothetical protein